MFFDKMDIFTNGYLFTYNKNYIHHFEATGSSKIWCSWTASITSANASVTPSAINSSLTTSWIFLATVYPVTSSNIRSKGKANLPPAWYPQNWSSCTGTSWACLPPPWSCSPALCSCEVSQMVISRTLQTAAVHFSNKSTFLSVFTETELILLSFLKI